MLKMARQFAEFLEKHDKVEFVNYPTLPSNKYYETAKKYLPNGGCGVVSFELKGGRAAAEKFMKNLKLAAIETHVADARTCCLNPATSTHRQMNDEQLAAAGIPAGLIRISCGLEDKKRPDRRYRLRHWTQFNQNKISLKRKNSLRKI